MSKKNVANWHFELSNGLKVDYNLFEIFTAGWDTGSIVGGKHIHNYSPRDKNFKSISVNQTPLALALNLPALGIGFQTLTGTLNGKAIRIEHVSDYYRLTFTATNGSFIFKEIKNDVPSLAYWSGESFGYNYYYQEYVRYQGSQGFSPNVASQVYSFVPEYSEDWITGNEPPSTIKDLQKGYVYQSVFPNDLHKGNAYEKWNTYTANIVDDNSLKNVFQQAEANPDFPTYPEPEPGGDEDGDEPSPPIPGDGDTDTEPIPVPPIPQIDVTNTGFVVIYNPTAQEIAQLASFMWSGDFADLIKKIFREPFAAIISLKMLFCNVPNGTKQTVWLGNVETNVSMSKVTQQFIDIDLGSITINEFFGSFADYSPFTKIQIYLPFIGYKDLNVDEVMNGIVNLKYRIDVYTGACIAFITVTKTIKSTNLNSVLYQFDGNCAMEVPFTSNDNSRYVEAILNAASSSALSLANSSTFSPPQIAQGYSKGEKASLELGSLAPVANGLLDIMSTKPNVQRAGSLAGAPSAMGVKQPYIIIHRPITQMPTNYQHYLGVPANLTRQLSAVSGYTIISQIFISSQIATDAEITMITELLKSGVIL